LKLKFIAPSWESIFSKSVELAEKVRAGNKISTFDLIVGVSRGGLVVTRLMSDLLAIDNVHIVRSEYYSDMGKRRSKPVITQKLQTSILKKKVLLVDDVADSGESLIVIKKYLLSKHPGLLSLATLYMKPWTKIVPDFWAAKTDAWIVFPWERYEVLRSLLGKRGGQDLLRQSGIPPRILSRLQRFDAR
jgi:uncharacterized protein